VEKPVEDVQKIRAVTAPEERGAKNMHTGITIEQLLATVARVDAKIENEQRVYREIPRVPNMPFGKTANLLFRPGVM
jgi:hypothetical protein